MAWPPLPPAFVQRMEKLLGREAAEFLESVQRPPPTGVRANTLQVSADQLARLLPFQLEPVPWCPDGFTVPEAERVRPGRHPYHAAGLYYVQEPSAMAAPPLFAPKPGHVVLDLCAAPGGKATYVAALLGESGLLIANEVVRRRTRALVENVERWGTRAVLITSARVEQLAHTWPGGLDAVLVDAPCSGEGMFSKSLRARQEWRPEVVSGCALRQGHLLAHAARLVRPGGRLLYATCTFAPEENEAVVARFLRAHPDCELLSPLPRPGFSPGRPEWIAPELARGLPLERCVRLWPHRGPAAGHFLALFRREGEASPLPLSAGRARLPSHVQAPVRAFWEETLTLPWPERGWLVRGHHVYLVPPLPPAWETLHAPRVGLHVGTVRSRHFVPAHALAMALRPEDVRHAFHLTVTDPRTRKYLRGEPLLAEGSDGWTLICVDGFSLGWAKHVRGILKNHYPRSRLLM
ncbi:MAG: RsmB/NOP family class I SAM-dependent RNA methyltransferase [Ardenticatenia bacterium]|nr:RsmB/NOP family class I SAM-dependent RNA methyltransferase [Ardenticatenia bacterium]